MQPIMIEDLVRWSGGRLLCGNSKDCVTSVSINSREIAPGSLFVPIVGEKVNAHRFIDSAFKAGAAAVLTQEQDAAPLRAPQHHVVEGFGELAAAIFKGD